MTAVDTLTAGLGLDPEEAQTRFDGLQEKLVPLWRSMDRMTHDEQTIVVVCSMSLEDPNWPAAGRRRTRSAFSSSYCCCGNPARGLST